MGKNITFASYWYPEYRKNLKTLILKSNDASETYPWTFIEFSKEAKSS